VLLCKAEVQFCEFSVTKFQTIWPKWFWNMSALLLELISNFLCIICAEIPENPQKTFTKNKKKKSQVTCTVAQALWASCE
jgi:hypothetical protein